MPFLGNNQSLQLWDISNGRLNSSKPENADWGNAKNVTALAFSPDSQLVLLASSGGYSTGKMIQLWDIESGHLIRSFQEPNKAGNAFDIIDMSLNNQGRCPWL